MSANWIQSLHETAEGRRLLEQERVLLEVTEIICKLMEASGVSKSQLARSLSKSPAFVTKILNGTNNFTLRTLSDVFLALGKSLHVELGPAGDAIRLPQTECFSLKWPSDEERVSMTIDVRGLAEEERALGAESQDPLAA